MSTFSQIQYQLDHLALDPNNPTLQTTVYNNIATIIGTTYYFLGLGATGVGGRANTYDNSQPDNSIVQEHIIQTQSDVEGYIKEFAHRPGWVAGCAADFVRTYICIVQINTDNTYYIPTYQEFFAFYHGLYSMGGPSGLPALNAVYNTFGQ